MYVLLEMGNSEWREFLHQIYNNRISLNLGDNEEGPFINVEVVNSASNANQIL